MMRARIDWIVVLTALLFALGCGGGGCGGCAGMEPIPGGFKSDKRRPNAGQVRITSSALAKITADPAAVIGPLAGGATNGIITFPIPASCSGTAICCPNGTMINNCGPIELDLVKRPTDPARLVLTPASVASPNGRLDVTMRTRVKTKNDLVVTLSGTDCKIHLDTTASGSPDLTFATQIAFQQDGTTGTTKIVASNTTVSLEDDDYEITPYSSSDFLCFGAAFVPRSTIENQIAGMLEDQINEATCKTCDSGNVAECSSPFATACTAGVCMQGGACLQEMGLNG